MRRKVGVDVTILGSGSAGNCTLIESATTRILIDAGLSARQITQRLTAVGRSIEGLNGILLTHEHSDHTRALPVLCKDRGMPVYANRLTAETLAEGYAREGRPAISWRLFSTGCPFEVGDFVVESFSVPHDAYDPVGFVIHHDKQAVAVLTDLGHPTKLVLERVRQANILVIEANHDVKMLQDDTARPWATKQRIMSRHGHLSNEAAGALVGDVVTERLSHVFLAHLSRDCNRPALAQSVITKELGRRGAAQVAVTVASQDTPTATMTL